MRPVNHSYQYIHTLSDLGILSNLTGSLSWTIQQYSAPSKWIMVELSVLHILEYYKNLLKIQQNPRVDIF